VCVKEGIDVSLMLRIAVPSMYVYTSGRVSRSQETTMFAPSVQTSCPADSVCFPK
jgi:hypothetical protein